MQTMDDQTVSDGVGELRAEIRGLRGDIQSMHRTMLCGFFSLAGLILTFAGFQLA